jgi:acetyl esterase
MPLHPQVRQVLDIMAAAGGRPVGEASVAEAREGAFGWPAFTGPGERVARVVDRFIPGPTADLPIRVYTPEGEGPFPAIVAFHGSGWVVGNIDICDAPHRELANRSGCVVVAVNYQKAPEHKFPVALDDCYAAACWVVANASALGVDPALVGVGGDSAGGNLAAACCLRARDHDGPRFAFQMLIYPATDLAGDYPSRRENADGYMLTMAGMTWFFAQYLNSPEEARNPWASPMAAADLAGLPPAVVVTAEFDPLRDEGEAYADKLAAAGVPTIKRRYDGMIHGWYWMGGYVEAAHVLIADLGRDIEALLRRRREAA